MEKREFQTHLKRMIDELRQDTLHKLIMHDSDYQDYCKEMTAAERAYIKLDLPQEQRQIVDEYLSLADMVNMEYCTFSYLAGILDSHKVADLFQLKEKTPQDNNLFIKDLFNGTFLLAKNDTESEKSELLLNTLSSAEQNFISSLNSEQQKSFKTLFSKRSEYISSASDDAFFYGFKLATTILTETLL